MPEINVLRQGSILSRLLFKHIKRGETVNKLNSSVLIWNANPETVFNIVSHLTSVKNPKLFLESRKVMTSRSVNRRGEARGKEQPGASISAHGTDCILISQLLPDISTL